MTDNPSTTGNEFDPARLRGIYDNFAADYDAGRGAFDNREQLARLDRVLPENARVLDCGCGSGLPVMRHFVERGDRVTGADISPAMLELARKSVPEAEALLLADTRSLNLPPASFDLITSFYSLFHIPRDHHAAVFQCWFELLKPGGHAYFTLAGEDYTGQPEFHGSMTFNGIDLPYSHYRPEQYQVRLQEIGFVLRAQEALEIGGETMLWLLVQRPA